MRLAAAHLKSDIHLSDLDNAQRGLLSAISERQVRDTGFVTFRSFVATRLRSPCLLFHCVVRQEEAVLNYQVHPEVDRASCLRAAFT